MKMDFLAAAGLPVFLYVKETTALLKVLNHLGRNTEYLDSVVPCIAVAF